MKEPHQLRMTWGSLATLAWLLIVLSPALTQETTVSQESVSSLVDQLKSRDWKTRQEAMQILRTNRPTGKVVASALIESLADANEGVRFQIGSALGLIMLQNPEILPTLVEALKHPRAEVREYVAFAFTYTRDRASVSAAMPVLLELLNDRHPRVRGRAVQALERVDPTNPSFVPPFIAALKDQDGWVRQIAAGALGSTGSESPEVINALTLALRDETPGVRMVAGDVLGRMKAHAKQVVSAVAEAQFNYTTNNGAITITGYIGSGGAVTIPDTVNGLAVNHIGTGAFRGCSSLTSVSIPGSVIGIGDGAFSSSSVTSVTIPISVTVIGPGAFGGCTNLQTITVDALNSIYSSMDGVLFDKNQTTLVQCPGGKADSCTIPNSVTAIGSSAFAGCTRLTRVTIPNSVTGIGNNAFFNCSVLTGVYFQGNAPIPNAVGLDLFNLADKATVYYSPSTAGWGATFGGRPTALESRSTIPDK
jgi:hypothetical protein